MANSTAGSHKIQFYELPIDLCCVISIKDRKIVDANAAFEHILGWKREEVIGQSIEGFVADEEGKKHLEEAFERLKKGVHSLNFETEFLAKNKLTRSIDWKGYTDSDNKNLFFIGRDITPYLEMQKDLKAKTHSDHLTGTFDRQTFLTILEKELGGAARYHYPASVIFIDIDHFSEFNEKNGISKGDECLKIVATALKACLRRKTDFLARFEKDQFVVLLSHNELEKGVKAAEYIHLNLEKLANASNSSNKKHHPITVSLGVAAVPDNLEEAITPDTLLNSAKHALKISKTSGGNQVNFSKDNFKKAA